MQYYRRKIMKMEKLQYKSAVMLAKILTEIYNNRPTTYSAACWGAHEIFRKKQLFHYGIYPEVTISDNKILVTAKERGAEDVIL